MTANASSSTNGFYVDESAPWLQEASGWPTQVPKNYDFPKISLYEMLSKTAAEHAKRPAMWFLDHFMNYKEFIGHVDALSSSLVKLGLKKGDVIALLLPNSFQYVISYYAITRLGGIITACNPTYKPLELLHQLRVTGAKALICLDALYEGTVKPIAAEAHLEHIIATNIADFMSPVKRFFGRLLGKIPYAKMPQEVLSYKKLLTCREITAPAPIDPVNDVAAYLMTGGSTGVPKAAQLTHFNLVTNAIQARLWLWKSGTGFGDIGVLPLFHAFAMSTVMNTPITCGGWILLFPKPPKMDVLCKTVCRLARYAIGDFVFCGVEVLFKRLIDFKNLDHYPIYGKLSLCVSGAGPLNPAIQATFEQKLGSRLVVGYGLTEASPVVSAGPFYGERHPESIGLPFIGTKWKIVDIENGEEELPTGPENIGEIVVCGPQVMKGYLKSSALDNDIREINGERWLFTGDLGYMDENGRVYIRDRKKQLIKYKGYSVFPQEIEGLLAKHPAIDEVAVAGLPDRISNEVIKAWVVLKDEFKGQVSEEDIISWAKENMAHHKVPRLVEFRQELPKSIVGKVMRRELRENDPLFKNAEEAN